MTRCSLLPLLAAVCILPCALGLHVRHLSTLTQRAGLGSSVAARADWNQRCQLNTTAEETEDEPEKGECLCETLEPYQNALGQCWCLNSATDFVGEEDGNWEAKAQGFTSAGKVTDAALCYDVAKTRVKHLYSAGLNWPTHEVRAPLVVTAAAGIMGNFPDLTDEEKQAKQSFEFRLGPNDILVDPATTASGYAGQVFMARWSWEADGEPPEEFVGVKVLFLPLKQQAKQNSTAGPDPQSHFWQSQLALDHNKEEWATEIEGAIPSGMKTYGHFIATVDDKLMPLLHANRAKENDPRDTAWNAHSDCHGDDAGPCPPGSSTVFIVTEWMPFGNLQQSLDSDFRRYNAQQRVFRALSFLSSIGSFLEWEESKGKTHGDIKPANLMWKSYWKATAIDFGEMRTMDEHGMVNQIGLQAKIQFEPPESVVGILKHRAGDTSTPVDYEKADLYGIGLVFLELLVSGESANEQWLKFLEPDKDQPPKPEDFPKVPDLSFSVEWKAHKPESLQHNRTFYRFVNLTSVLQSLADKLLNTNKATRSSESEDHETDGEALSELAKSLLVDNFPTRGGEWDADLYGSFSKPIQSGVYMSSSRDHGSLGFIATDSEGRHYGLTNAHVLPKADAVVVQPNPESFNGALGDNFAKTGYIDDWMVPFLPVAVTPWDPIPMIKQGDAPAVDAAMGFQIGTAWGTEDLSARPGEQEWWDYHQIRVLKPIPSEVSETDIVDHFKGQCGNPSTGIKKHKTEDDGSVLVAFNTMADIDKILNNEALQTVKGKKLNMELQKKNSNLDIAIIALDDSPDTYYQCSLKGVTDAFVEGSDSRVDTHHGDELVPETLIGQEVYRSGAYSRMKGVVVAVNVRYKESSFYPDTDYDMVIVATEGGVTFGKNQEAAKSLVDFGDGTPTETEFMSPANLPWISNPTNDLMEVIQYLATLADVTVPPDMKYTKGNESSQADARRALAPTGKILAGHDHYIGSAQGDSGSAYAAKKSGSNNLEVIGLHTGPADVVAIDKASFQALFPGKAHVLPLGSTVLVLVGLAEDDDAIKPVAAQDIGVKFKSTPIKFLKLWKGAAGYSIGRVLHTIEERTGKKLSVCKHSQEGHGPWRGGTLTPPGSEATDETTEEASDETTGKSGKTGKSDKVVEDRGLSASPMEQLRQEVDAVANKPIGNEIRTIQVEFPERTQEYKVQIAAGAKVLKLKRTLAKLLRLGPGVKPKRLQLLDSEDEMENDQLVGSYSLESFSTVQAWVKPRKGVTRGGSKKRGGKKKQIGKRKRKGRGRGRRGRARPRGRKDKGRGKGKGKGKGKKDRDGKAKGKGRGRVKGKGRGLFAGVVGGLSP